MAAGRIVDPGHWLCLLVIWQCVSWVSVEGSIISRCPESAEQYRKTKLIVDVDAGGDDALALLMLLSPLAAKESFIDVMAITCVNGNTLLDNVVVNVLKTLKVAGRLDIPVFKGSRYSLQRTPPSDNFYGNDGFGDFHFEGAPNPRDFLKKEHAVSALIRMVSQHPGEVTLLAIGPLTNIALAVRLQPDFLKKLKRLIVLGGSVHGVGNVNPGVEFNFYMDPVAADIVFNTTDKPICLVPWETAKVSSPVTMSWRKNVLGELQSPKVEFLNLVERIAFKSDDGQWISSDSFAAFKALQVGKIDYGTSTCGGKPVHADVLTACGDSAGAVLVDYAMTTGKPVNVEIVEMIDVSEFKDIVSRYLCS